MSPVWSKNTDRYVGQTNAFIVKKILVNNKTITREAKALYDSLYFLFLVVAEWAEK